MLMSFKDYFDKQVQHRHRHPVLRDPGTRKHVQTVPSYIRPKQTPKPYNDIKKEANGKRKSLSTTDAQKVQNMFGVKNIKPGEIKGLKRTGTGLRKSPATGRVEIVKTK